MNGKAQGREYQIWEAVREHGFGGRTEEFKGAQETIHTREEQGTGRN